MLQSLDRFDLGLSSVHPRKRRHQFAGSCEKVMKNLPGLFDGDVVPLPAFAVLVTVLVEDDAVDTSVLSAVEQQLLLSIGERHGRLAKGVRRHVMSHGWAARVTGMQGRRA